MTETHYEIRVDRGEARTKLVDYETDLDEAETFYYDLRRLLFRYAPIPYYTFYF